MDPSALQRRLADAGTPFTVSFHPSTRSTQVDAKRLVQTHGAGAWLVIAGEQTAGHGRQGRAWLSNRGDLACSIVMPLELPPERWGKLAQLAGLSTAAAIRQLTGLASRVKWPNDVFIEDAKVAGCLGEVVETPTGQIAVLGIGVNVVGSDIAGRVEQPLYPITTLADHGAHPTLEDLATAIATTLWERCDWPRREHDAEFLEWWREYSLTRSQVVRVAQPDGSELVGESIGLDPTGALILRDAQGAIHTIIAGDVSVKPVVP